MVYYLIVVLKCEQQTFCTAALYWAKLCCIIYHLHIYLPPQQWQCVVYLSVVYMFESYVSLMSLHNVPLQLLRTAIRLIASVGTEDDKIN